MSLTTIISGGQTGADMGALMAAKYLKLHTGGIAPVGFLTEAGPNLDLDKVYGLIELDTNGKKISRASMYTRRSILNVDNSDGTIAFRFRSSIGTDKTIGYCINKIWRYPKNIEHGIANTNYKPLLIIKDMRPDNDELIKSWLTQNNIVILNVCGHREHENQGIVYDIIVNALQK